MTNQIYTDKTEYLKYFNFINGAIQTESWNKIYKIKNNLNMYSSNPTAFTDLYVEGAGINYWNCSQKGVGGGGVVLFGLILPTIIKLIILQGAHDT